MHDTGCDSCGRLRELYHFDATVDGNPYDGYALCDECTTSAAVWDAQNRDEADDGPFDQEAFDAQLARADDLLRAQDGEDGPFHAELRLIVEQAEGTPLAALVPQAQALLALPEESVAALVAAAQSMVAAVDAAR